jgi:hypothetical protein
MVNLILYLDYLLTNKLTMSSKIECECHKVDWTGGPGNYTVISTGKPLNEGSNGSEEWMKENSICCQDKVNYGIMGMDTYKGVCNYIPGKTGTRFPSEVYLQLLGPPREAVAKEAVAKEAASNNTT